MNSNCTDFEKNGNSPKTTRCVGFFDVFLIIANCVCVRESVCVCVCVAWGGNYFTMRERGVEKGGENGERGRWAKNGGLKVFSSREELRETLKLVSPRFLKKPQRESIQYFGGLDRAGAV